MRFACLSLLGAGLLATDSISADPIQILSLSRSGDLAWVNTNLATGTYRVEFKHHVTDDWEPVPGLENVVSAASTTEVPRFALRSAAHSVIHSGFTPAGNGSFAASAVIWAFCGAIFAAIWAATATTWLVGTRRRWSAFMPVKVIRPSTA